jgi:glutamate carboxypeptidase
MFTLKKTAFFVLVCFSALTFAQKTNIEKRIVKSVDKNIDEAIVLLKKAININSGTMNFKGVIEVGELFKTELDALGFETKLTSGKSYNRAGHLIAVHKGNIKGPKILMIGHLDTVFEEDSPLQECSMLNDSIMKGPGVADMKGGDVIIILAMKALKEAGLLEDASIEIIMTGDEEKSGAPIENSKKDLIEAAKTADIALGFENGDNRTETIVVSRRGSADWELIVTGNPAHSSQIFTKDIGAGAIYETSRILNEFYLQLSNEKDLTFNPGFILGGTNLETNSDKTGGTTFGKNNVVAQTAVVHGDLRAVSPEQLEKAKAIMLKIINNNYPNTTAKIVFGKGAYPPLAKTKGNLELLEQYNMVSKDLGFGKVEAVNPRNAGAADISFTSGYVAMAIDGMGLTGGSGDHTINETGNLNSVAQKAKITAVLIYRLLNAKK